MGPPPGFTSCQDLIGVPLTQPLTGNTASATITNFHCEAIEAAMTATEMRLWPTHCNFDTILDSNPPVQTGAIEVLNESFDSAPDGWTLVNRGVFDEYEPRNWVWTEVRGGLEPGARLILNVDRDGVEEGATVTPIQPSADDD